MSSIKLRYDVDGSDFISCGKASEDVKRTLKSIGMPSDVIRKVSIAMYEGEVNMVIHAEGGVAEVEIFDRHRLDRYRQGYRRRRKGDAGGVFDRDRRYTRTGIRRRYGTAEHEEVFRRHANR